MQKRSLSIVAFGLLIAAQSSGWQQKRSALPVNSHFPQFQVRLREDGAKHGTWMAIRKSDNATFRVETYHALSRPEALRIAEGATVGQNWTGPAKFVTKSLATGRSIGEAYWIADKAVTKIKGGTKIVVRQGNEVFVGMIANISWSKEMGADQKPISKADLTLLEDLILEAIHQPASTSQ